MTLLQEVNFLEIKEITSRQNSTLVWAASLSEKKYREKHKTFLADGVKLVEEALVSHLPVSHIFIEESKREEYLPLILSLTENRKGDVPQIFLLSSPCFEKISTEKAPQGKKILLTPIRLPLPPAKTTPKYLISPRKGWRLPPFSPFH